MKAAFCEKADEMLIKLNIPKSNTQSALHYTADNVKKGMDAIFIHKNTPVIVPPPQPPAGLLNQASALLPIVLIVHFKLTDIVAYLEYLCSDMALLQPNPARTKDMFYHTSRQTKGTIWVVLELSTGSLA